MISGGSVEYLALLLFFASGAGGGGGRVAGRLVKCGRSDGIFL